MVIHYNASDPSFHHTQYDHSDWPGTIRHNSPALFFLLFFFLYWLVAYISEQGTSREVRTRQPMELGL
jgi:hypothetical protein